MFNGALEFTCTLFFMVTVLNSLTRAVLISSNMLVAFSVLPAKETEPLILKLQHLAFLPKYFQGVAGW